MVMSISRVFLLLLYPFNLVFVQAVNIEPKEITLDGVTWLDFTPSWCTRYGRKKLSKEAVPKSESCMRLCVKLNPYCKAVEWWTKAGGLCFECTQPSWMRRYRDPSDLANPPHVFIEKLVNTCQSSPCKNGATCTQTETPQRYECTCRLGYKGVNCETDINECAYHNGGCSHKCKNTNGSYHCSCPDPELSLAPDNHSCIANGVTVQCGEKVMAITLPKSLLLGLNREHLTLRDENCVATETSTHFTLTTTLTGCDTIARYRGKATVYSNTVMEIPVAGDAIITRVREIKIPFRCYYKNSGQAFAVGVEPDTRKLVFNEDGKGNFTVALDMFPDERFSSAFTRKDYPVEVKLRQHLYFQASVKTKDKTLSVLAENCYATHSKNRNHDDKYYLIKDGCPVDKTTAVVKSIKVSKARFKTEAFKFIADHPFVFVHCEIRICDARNSNSRCVQGCITEIRKRRDVRNDDVLYPLAQGPLTISSDVTMNLSSDRKSALQGVTVPAVLAMAVISSLCIVGMVWLINKRSL